MTYPLINITDHEIGNVMYNLGISERTERIRQLLYWAQQRVLESLADGDSKEAAIGKD